MLLDGAGTERCHCVKSIPSFSLKEKKLQKKKEKNKQTYYWASTCGQFAIIFLIQISIYRLDQTVTLFLKCCLYHTISNEIAAIKQWRLRATP